MLQSSVMLARPGPCHLGMGIWPPGFPALTLHLLARCVHLQHKILPHWIWEKIPDPANSNFSLPHMKVSEKPGFLGSSRGLGKAGTVGNSWELGWGDYEGKGPPRI